MQSRYIETWKLERQEPKTQSTESLSRITRRLHRRCVNANFQATTVDQTLLDINGAPL